jgi:multiple sugar transport system ATP-binding protein
MVFQNYALYPYLTVAANIGFPLRIAKVKKAERDKRVREVAKLLGLSDYLERKPAQLSGGQRQRVARLQSDFGITTVYVTHDQAEAMTLGHRVAVLHEGRLQQCGPPRELYEKPVNMFVAGFIGSPAMNLCSVELGSNGSVSIGGVEVALPRGVGVNGKNLVVGLRPESLEVAGEGIRATVDVVEDVGADAFVFCTADLPGVTTKLVARTEVRNAPKQGEVVTLRPRAAEAHIFDPVSGERLDGR